jgi:aspartate/methionine/tyrosine aminotransferase
MKELEYSGTLKIVDKLRQLSERGFDIVNFAGGTLDDSPRVVKEATKKAIDDGFGSDLTDSAGLLELRMVVAERLKLKEGVKADPRSQIIVTIGAKNAVLQALQATLEPEDEVLILDPYWPSYKQLVILTGAVLRSVPMGNKKRFEVDVDNILGRITAKSRMIIINTPHNPTGRVFTSEELEGICDIAKKYNLFVLSDECYKELIYDHKKHYSIASFRGMAERTITVYSFSKAYTMYGWRVGYAVGDPEIVRRMVTIQSNSVSCPTSFAQKGAVAALKKGEEHLRRVVENYQRLRDTAVQRLNEIKGVSCETPQGGYWVFPNVSEITNPSDPLVEYLLETGKIATIPGSAFGESRPEHLRIIYRHELDYLTRGLKRLKETIKNYQAH